MSGAYLPTKSLRCPSTITVINVKYVVMVANHVMLGSSRRPGNLRDFVFFAAAFACAIRPKKQKKREGLTRNTPNDRLFYSRGKTYSSTVKIGL